MAHQSEFLVILDPLGYNRLIVRTLMVGISRMGLTRRPSRSLDSLLQKGSLPFMSQDPRTLSSIFTQVDIGAGNQPVQPQSSGSEQTDVLREILAAQDRNNALLEELVPLTAEYEAPIAVVDEQGRLRGEIDRAAVLISMTVSPAAAQDDCSSGASARPAGA